MSTKVKTIGNGSHHSLMSSAPKPDSLKKKPTKPSSAKKAEDHVSQVDFSTMDDRVLRRYKRTFKLRAKSSKESRDELVSSVTKHFLQQEINEKDTITFFIYTLRNQENVYKLPPKVPVVSS
ncbi:uncharacterized protein SPPG_08678 [Spizellomyces punctatus DAOM BR117]|uniref:Histone deacetylase complex subunit SAP30 Sin3 binding domain-containing protein n=1 Tax=Spizellomyces punctatus (strain DAOM BR117) TaxID=645134 RepID=A0A0L0H3Z3_SPIPD|nr:uncharacterized protein SPPG_08678 [Spizellomyces punctatus DAOM BR117]KNC95922.1 hypothetical protein SPPG_08678 [Spizellomyces punctatus DAOM BR117]|eukprot:XP_016603962.1 hypothetical protein SPPG_08678 [Spizellomyces punctatus DAOM BR117]